MTEKRFECDKGSRIIIDNETKLHYIMTLDWECSLITKLLNHFAEENEELKKENMEYYQLVNCGNCKYHNYDWFDDGDEFEICDKGHTERLMYNKFCKEWEEL